MKTADEARQILGVWIGECYDYDLPDGFELPPVMAAHVAILSDHVDAERERLAELAEQRRQLEQARVDALPRKLRHVLRIPSRGMHRTPIECWHPLDGDPVYIEGIKHGEVAGILARYPTHSPEPLPSLFAASVPGLLTSGTSYSGLYMSGGCCCVTEAIVDATDEWAQAWNERPYCTVTEPSA